MLSRRATTTLLVLALPCPLSRGLAQVNAAAIDSVFSSIAANAPGCAMGVYRNGRIAYSKGYGLADLERRTPITPSSLFSVQSLTKQFVAGAVTLLALDGKLRLDDDVRRYVPELRDFGVRITLRDLMRHRSGIRETDGVTALLGARVMPDRLVDSQGGDTARLVRELDAINRFDRPAFPPNSSYAYSNTDYVILSAVISRVSGMPRSSFIKRRMFDPLGMQDSFVQDGGPADTLAGAKPYIKKGVAWTRNVPDRGSVMSSIEDLQRWDENFYTDKLGGRQWRDLMLDPGTYTNGAKAFYAHGLFVTTYRGLPIVFHNGSGSMQSALLRFPTRHTSVAVLCNYRTAPATVFAARTAEVVLRDAFPVQPSPRKVTSANFPWSGLYVDTVGIRVFRASPDSLRHVDDSTYLDDRYLTILHFSHVAGRPRLNVEAAMAMHEFPSFDPWTPTPEELSGYAGQYANDAFGLRHELSVVNGTLMLKRGAREPQLLEPTFKDAFMAEGFLVMFRRNSNGTISGLSYRSERVPQLDFRRVP